MTEGIGAAFFSDKVLFIRYALLKRDYRVVFNIQKISSARADRGNFYISVFSVSSSFGGAQWAIFVSRMSPSAA